MMCNSVVAAARRLLHDSTLKTLLVRELHRQSLVLSRVSWAGYLFWHSVLQMPLLPIKYHYRSSSGGNGAGDLYPTIKWFYPRSIWRAYSVTTIWYLYPCGFPTAYG